MSVTTTIYSTCDGQEYVNSVHKDNVAKTIKILQNKRHDNIRVI